METYAGTTQGEFFFDRKYFQELLQNFQATGKNTGVGCHFLFQYMKVKSESEVAQSCPTLSDPIDGSHF